MAADTLLSNNPRWCSYRQAAAPGWQVRKGEKALLLQADQIENKTADSGQEIRRIPILRNKASGVPVQIGGDPIYSRGSI